MPGVGRRRGRPGAVGGAVVLETQLAVRGVELAVVEIVRGGGRRGCGQPFGEELVTSPPVGLGVDPPGGQVLVEPTELLGDAHLTFLRGSRRTARSPSGLGDSAR
ncbi:hypothetical protein [Actinomycetospora sp. CA-053990]|uniref:hypothetical protein n=1 Tax=Actinomycetospora sp. CA-053990 TaxID=3239891 RepID=UPI003D9142CD